MISVLLATYSENGGNQDYLDLCLKSLAEQTMKNFEIILVSSGAYKPNVKGLLNSDVHFHSNERLHYPSAVAKAYEMSDSKNEYLFFLNDDVILNKFCLERLQQVVSHNDLLVNPHSNCDDNGRFYASGMPYSKLQYRIDEMKYLAPEIIKRTEFYPPFLLFQNQIHLYATMMRRATYEKIGKIDTNYKTGFDDADLSRRALEIGVRSAIYLPAYALHGSGVTADQYLTTEDRDFNEKYFKEKFKL